MFQDYAESTMNELLGLYGFEKFDRTETEHLNVDRFTSPKADDSLSPLDDASRDDVSVGSCDSSSGRSDLSRYNRSKFWWYRYFIPMSMYFCILYQDMRIELPFPVYCLSSNAIVIYKQRDWESCKTFYLWSS